MKPNAVEFVPKTGALLELLDFERDQSSEYLDEMEKHAKDGSCYQVTWPNLLMANLRVC